MKKLTTDGKLIARAVKSSSVVEVFNIAPFCICWCWKSSDRGAEVSNNLMENAYFSLLLVGLGRNQDQETPTSGWAPKGRGQSDCLCGKAGLVFLPACLFLTIETPFVHQDFCWLVLIVQQRLKKINKAKAGEQELRVTVARKGLVWCTDFLCQLKSF